MLVGQTVMTTMLLGSSRWRYEPIRFEWFPVRGKISYNTLGTVEIRDSASANPSHSRAGSKTERAQFTARGKGRTGSRNGNPTTHSIDCYN